MFLRAAAELGEQAGLADARLTLDRHTCRPPAHEHAQHRIELRKLGVASDDRPGKGVAAHPAASLNPIGSGFSDLGLFVGGAVRHGALMPADRSATSQADWSHIAYVSGGEVTDRIRDLVQRDDPVNDGRARARRDQCSERVEVWAVLVRDERPEALTHEGRQHHGTELAVETPRASTAAFVADADQRSVASENATEL